MALTQKAAKTVVDWRNISSIQTDALGITMIILWNVGWILSLTDVGFYAGLPRLISGLRGFLFCWYVGGPYSVVGVQEINVVCLKGLIRYI